MKREQWGSRAGFILAAVGSAIGLGNIWRFPYVAYENGGGAFFIPYLFAMLTAGIPFMILEFSMGHKLRKSAPFAFARISARLEWLGWFQVMIAALIGIYYIAVIGWAISYIFFSFNQSWGTDTSTFFYSEFLNLGDDNSPSQLGSIQWPIAAAMAVAWCVTFAAILGGVKAGIERASKIMMPILFIMILLLIARVVFLDGATMGLNYLFEPDFSRLSDFEVWGAAYGQIFFTLSVGFAIMLAYSSYLPEKSDINNNAIMTVLINCGFSILAGILIFSILGYMATSQDVPITEVVAGGPGLAFVTLPAAINLLPIPYILGPLFFISLTVAGFSSHISITEAVTSAVIDKFNCSRKVAASCVCGFGLVVSMAFATNGGLLLLDVVDFFLNNIALLSSCLIELILVAYAFKVSTISAYSNKVSDFSIGFWFSLCIQFITPLALLVILPSKFIQGASYGGYSPFDLTVFGWGMLALMLLIAIYINIQNRPKGEF